jgi:HTH-type transcriptional regulator, glycine betaine synthesis regulator
LLLFMPKLAPPSAPRARRPATAPEGYEDEVIAIFADLVELLGLPKSMGEIYGYLFAAPEPRSPAEIERRLGLSKGSVSQGLRALRELGAVHEAGPAEEGSEDRSARWAAAIELRHLIGSLLRERLVPYLGRQDERLKRADRALVSATPDLAEDARIVSRERLNKLKTWQTRARAVLPLLGKML